MDRPPVVSPEEAKAAREALFAKELKAAEAHDELAAERRRLPWVRIDKDYAFEGPDGPARLVDLFDGCSQLIVYRFFFQEGVADFPHGGCPGCSLFVDGTVHPAHLRANDTSFVLASPAPQADIERFRSRMGWEEFPWYTILDDEFSTDFGVDEWFGLVVFSREGDEVFQTYWISHEPAHGLGNYWSLADLTPTGQQGDLNRRDRY